jgi:hypothetical protein
MLQEGINVRRNPRPPTKQNKRLNFMTNEYTKESIWTELPRFKFLATAHGFEILSNPNLGTKSYTRVKRSLKERFLSWPWRPWRSYKEVCTFVPSRQIYREGSKLIMHPDMSAILIQAINYTGSYWEYLTEKP